MLGEQKLLCECTQYQADGSSICIVIIIIIIIIIVIIVCFFHSYSLCNWRLGCSVSTQIIEN
jgi:hypothetical protein